MVRVKICLWGFPRADTIISVSTPYLRYTSVGIQSSRWCSILSKSFLRWFLALVCGRVNAVHGAKEPLDTTFTVEMLCSASPPAVRRVNDAEPSLTSSFFVLTSMAPLQRRQVRSLVVGPVASRAWA